MLKSKQFELKQIIIFLLVIFIFNLIFFVPINPMLASFNDIKDHWAHQDILRMNARGILQGDGKGNFKPNDFITREEVIAAIVKIVGITDTGQFQLGSNINIDSAKGLGAWAREYLYHAYQRGVIADLEIQLLNWNGAATRQETAYWLARAYNVQPDNTDYNNVLSRFDDSSDLDLQKAPYIIPLIRDNIIVGSNGKLHPDNTITRAEFSAILNRIDIRYPMNKQQGASYIIPVNPVDNTQFVFLEGTFVGIDWQQATIRVNINNIDMFFPINSILFNQLNMNYLSGNAYQFGDKVQIFINNGFVERIFVLDSPSRDSSDDSSDNIIIYKGTLDSVDERRARIVLRSGTVKYISGSRWRSKSGSLRLDVADKADIYYWDEEIEFDELEDYLRDTVYIVYDEDYEEVIQMRVARGTERTYKDAIREINTSRERFVLEDERRKIYYDEGTIVLHEDRLVDGDYLVEDDEVFVVVDRVGNTYRAAVVIIMD